MTTDTQPRARLRNLLLFIILATIPCYCAGLVAILLAPESGGVPTATLIPSFTPAIFPSSTPYPTSPHTPTPGPSLTFSFFRAAGFTPITTILILPAFSTLSLP